MAKTSSYPTAAEMLHHPARVARRMAFENMNAIARCREVLLRGECDLAARLNAQAVIIHAAHMARRNDFSAKCHGFRLPG